MKKRSMLAIASLAAGVVTALVSPPPPHASAADHGVGGATGLLQNDNPVAPLLEDTAPLVTDTLPQTPDTGGLV